MKPYPGQFAVAGELPADQVYGTLVVIQHNVSSFWISCEVELTTHCGVSSGWKNKTLITHSYTS